MSWRRKAKCRTMSPALFLVENLTAGREDVEAQQLCAGCLVQPACAADALKPIDLSFLGLDDVDVIYQSGVVRGGIPIE